MPPKMNSRKASSRARNDDGSPARGCQNNARRGSDNAGNVGRTPTVSPGSPALAVHVGPRRLYATDPSLVPRVTNVLNPNHGFVSIKYSLGGRLDALLRELEFQLVRPLRVQVPGDSRADTDRTTPAASQGGPTPTEDGSSVNDGVETPASSGLVGDFGISVDDSGVDVSTPATSLGLGNMMAPVNGIEKVSGAIRDVIHDLYDIQSKVHGYQHETQGPLLDKMVDLAGSLSKVNTLSQTTNLPAVPPELVDYADEGRNPDIYTREIVELVQRGNAVVNGKKEAFRSFSMIYAEKLRNMEPVEGMDCDIDMRKEVDAIMRKRGLLVEAPKGKGEANGKAGENGDVSGEKNGDGIGNRGEKKA